MPAYLARINGSDGGLNLAKATLAAARIAGGLTFAFPQEHADARRSHGDALGLSSRERRHLIASFAAKLDRRTDVTSQLIDAPTFSLIVQTDDEPDPEQQARLRRTVLSHRSLAAAMGSVAAALSGTHDLVGAYNENLDQTQPTGTVKFWRKR